MTDIKVFLKDYSMMYVDCDNGIAKEISEYFSFFVPGYKWMPAFKNKLWDGKIRLFNLITGELNAGLYVYLLKMCSERGYTIETEENEWGLPLVNDNIDTLEFNEFLNTLNLPFLPYEYQYDAIVRGLNQNRAILLSPTGSGKSFIIYLLIQYYLRMIRENKEKVLIIVPTTSLVEQLYSDMTNDYKMPKGEDLIHKIYSGQDKTTSKPIIISTWQSIYKFPKTWFEKFGMIIGDECHGFKSKSLSSIMNKSTEAKYRFGLTGTLDGTQTHKLVLEGLFGPVYKVTTTKALQDDNTLAPLDIKIPVLQYPQELKKTIKGMTYQDEISFLCEYDPRNKFITNLANSMKGNTLVLFNYVEKHGKPLYDLINSKVRADRNVYFVSGEVKTEDREAIRKLVDRPLYDDITLTFSEDIRLKVKANVNVPLSDGTTKLAKDITIEDDVDNEWIKSKLKGLKK